MGSLAPQLNGRCQDMQRSIMFVAQCQSIIVVGQQNGNFCNNQCKTPTLKVNSKLGYLLGVGKKTNPMFVLRAYS